jgi:DNA-binding NtrC family response regulator
VLLVCGDDIRTFELPSKGRITIGRAEDAVIRIDDPSVSRQHAVLHVGDALTLEDLGGPNGTLVRERVPENRQAETLSVRQINRRSVDVTVGDTFTIGTASLTIRHSAVTDALDLGDAKDGIVVRDPAMRDLYGKAKRAAATTISVLVLGETGVGKEILARAIHAHSPRAKGPFVAINCAALTETLIDSELFGHEKGAFTGALQQRAGVFESANGGTVFLDEVGELSAPAQAKLLRVLQERVVNRVGSLSPRPIDVRVVAATNRDLEAEIDAGRFRADLFFRLNGVALTVPPLRTRGSEIELLAQMFLAAACKNVDRAEPPTFSAAASKLLRSYRWPGNIRELRNAIDHVAVFCAGNLVLPEHFPPSMTKTSTTVDPNDPRAAERARVVDALERCAGSQSAAARMLRISRGTLIARIEEFNLPRPRKGDSEPEDDEPRR